MDGEYFLYDTHTKKIITGPAPYTDLERKIRWHYQTRAPSAEYKLLILKVDAVVKLECIAQVRSVKTGGKIDEYDILEPLPKTEAVENNPDANDEDDLEEDHHEYEPARKPPRADGIFKPLPKAGKPAAHNRFLNANHAEDDDDE